MCILQCLGYCPKSYVRVLTQSDTLTIAREKAAKALKEKGDTPEELLQSIKENEAAAAEAQRVVDAWKAIVGEKSRREEAAKAEAERIATEKAEAERKAVEERERAEAEEEARVEAERKAEDERIAKQKAEEKTEEAESDKEEAEKRMNDEEPKPVGSGVFGNIYNQFKGKVKEAFDFLMKHKGGDLLGVFHRKDVGDIDLVWGDHGGGLAHIIRRHIIEQNDFKNVDEIQKVIDDVIRNGLIVRENKDKINIEYNGYRVSIKKTIRDSKGNVVENKNWIVTAFDKSKPKHEKRNPSSSETLTTPSANQKADGVTLPSNEDSIDKGSKKAEKKQKKQSVFDKAKEIADKEEKKRKAEAEDDKPKEQSLTEAERKDAEEVAGALGYRVEWVDTMAENGTIDADKKVIRIAKDAENPLVQVLGHEVAHGVKRMDGGKFKALQKAAMEVVGEKEWNERIEKKRGLNAYAEGKLAEEVTCDIVGEALNDKDALKRLAESLRGEKGILARLRDAVARMVEYFKNRGDREGVRRMKAADKLLAEFESALKEGDGVNESAREADVPTDNVGNIDFSHRTYHDHKDDDGNEHRGTRGKIIEYLNNAGMKKSDIGKFVDNMDYWYDLTGKVASLVDKDGNFDFPAFHEWSQTSPLYKKYEGNIVRAVSTLVSNGEYPLNFELSTDCIKREAFTQILNEMVDLGGAIWKNLTPAKIQELRTLQQSYGIQVACPLCFVEGKRLNIMKWATGVTDKWNEAVRRVVGDEATPFGFGKGTYVPATPYNERTTPQEVTDQINEVARIVGSREGALPKDLARMQENTKAMEALLQQYYEDYVAKHGSAEGFSLSEAQLGELAKLRGKGASNVVDRMVDMIATHPELQHTLDVSDLVGSKGLMAIRGQSGEGFAKMYSLIVCANGTGTPKIVQDAQPYSGDILDVRQSKFDKAAEIGGARLFSFSDFDLTKTFDIMQIMWDCAARKAKVQSYSKEIPYILMFGKSGVKINMSMLPEARPSEGLVQEYKEAKGSARKYVLEKIRENAGLDMEGGHIVGIQLSDSHSVSKEFAESIYHNPDYNANCGAIMVGISVNHALYAMGQDYIRQVIPFHLSGMPISARRATDCQYYRDFTSEQNTGIIVNGRRVKQFDGGGKPIHNKDVTSDFDFYEGENEKGWDMRQRCRDYVKWCGENGLVPRFEWAVNSDNYKAWCKKKGYQPNQEIVDMMDAHTTDGVYDEYYKVITDFTAYKPIFDKDGNTIGEEPAPHRPVTGDFAMDDKTLGMVLGVDSEGRKVDDNSMLANRENTIKNADANKKEIAEKALLILNGKAKVEDLVRKGGEQFDNNSDSDKFFESSNEGIDRSVRESRSEKTELTEEERELRDNLVERMRKGGLDVVTDSEEMQRVIDTENERTRNMFVGEKGATEADKAEEVSTRLDNLSVARRMEEAGKDAKAIKMATGWERGTDGKWRYETSDIKPKPFEEWMNKKNLKLGDIIDSDSGLFEMYPELKDFKVTRGKGKSTNAAIYTGLGKIEINFSKFKPYMSIPSNREKIDGILHRVINHEIQHAIQDSEGFAQGVSPNAFRPDAPIGKLREMEEADGRMVERYNAMSYTEKALGEGVRLKERILENRKEYNALASKYRFGMDGYTRAAGEVEARNTEKRIGMTEEERRASLASETEDVAREDQILLGVDNADGEMNTGSVREHRVYHGSGADFDAFDHSHMGEGEGAQAYGWGTYVTEVEGIGRTYAIQNTTTHNDALRALQHDVDAISDQLDRHRDDLKYVEEQLKRANEWRAEAELDYELFKDEAEKLKEKYGEASPKYRNHLFNDIYTDEMKRAQSSVKSTEESIQYRKEKIAELEKALKDKQAEIDELPKEFPRHLYTVEIPDDNGSNYLDWNGHPAKSLLKDVGSFLESEGFERVQDNPARYEKGESTVVLNPNATGADLYAELQKALGSDKKASQALAELGCIGIKYPADNMRGGRKDGAKNYVIFNENDAKITDHTRFLRTAGGEVFGLVKDGRIYLDPKVATAETAVHEYTHLWGDMLRRKDSEQWSHTVKELKNSVLWEEVKELYPELKTDDEIADEVLSTFSGRRGAERLREEARRVADGDGGVFTKAKAIETLERVKEAIARFWEGVARMFGINRYRSAEELADMAMKDLLDSKNPMKGESGMRKRGEVGETLATSGTYFSGGGLLEAGLKGVIDPKVAVEFSEKIAGVYADNHGNHIVVADVRDVDPKKLVGAVDGGEVQYFHASPVCKNFSKAKREGGEVELDKETALSTAEFIAKTRPKVVTIENVKGYRNSEALKIITDELTRQGYDWDADVYNAADYGGYTKRERLIVRAKRDGKLPPKPEKLPEELRKKGWYSAVEDLIPHLEEKKTGVPQGTDERLKNSGIDYRTIDKPLYVFGRGYANKTVGHAFADELLPTLTTGGGDIIIMPDGRVLKASPRVLARVTGLPDTYKMPETDQLSHTIVGNGIPTQLTEGVIAPLLDNAIPSAERATKRESVFDVADRVSQNLEARTRAMGSRVEKRMADVAQKLEGKELSMEQKAVVDVFSGEKDNQKFSVERNGVKQQFLLKQGQEDKAGAKHSLYRHYGTNTGVITADDVLKIPQVLERGERIEKAKGGKKMAVYTMDIDGVKYTVLTRVGKNNEIVDDFYSNKKGSESSVYRNVENIDNTPEGARRKDSEPSAKVEDKSESPKLFGEEIIDDGKKGSDSIDRSVRENPKNEDKPRYSRKPGESIFDYASRVSEDVDRSVRERVSARDEYEKRVKSKGFQTKEALQNSMLGLQEFMFAIDHASGNKRYIEDIPDFENPILGENRLSSVNKEEMHQVAKTQFKPLMSAVAKLSGNGKESGELYDYMFAKHGLERDAVMRQREAQKEFDKYQKANPKGTKTIGDFVASLEGKDYAGLTALTAEDGRVKSIQSQIDAIDEQMKATDDQLLLRNLGGQKKRLKVDLLNAARDAADDIRKAFESNPSHDRSDINELWSRVNEVNGNTLRKLYESGLLTKEAYNDISSMYTNYIPMRGFDQTTSADAYAYLTHGDSAFNAPIKTAKGRSSKADNPIAYMQAMAESAIMQGNRNVLVKQKMLNFVRNHPSDLASVSDVWLQYDSVADEWKPVFPDNIGANDSASVVAKKMEAFEDKMKQMAEKHPDLVQRSNEAPDIPYKVVEKGQLNEHQVLVKQNGKSYIITVNGSPRAAQAANGLTNPDTDLTGAVGKVFEGAEALNRQLSSLYTTLNPDFIGSNYVRDALYSNTMVYVKEGAKYGGSFNFNFAKYNPAEMANLYARYNKGSLDTSNETHRLFLEFMQNGGETGFVNLKQIEKRKSEIAKAIKRDGRISAAQIWGGLSDAVDFANRAVENSARFAAYVTSRKSGRSVGRSVYDAKEISVNFNRKGSGRELVERQRRNFSFL